MAKSTRIAFILISILALSLTAATGASEFRLGGTCIYRVLKADGTLGALRESQFQIWVNGPQWKLERVPVRFIRDGIVRDVLEDSCVASSDGTNLYYLMSFPTNTSYKPAREGSNNSTILRAARPGLGGTNHSENIAAGIIAKGAIPYNMPDSAISILWYAFASEFYFSNIKDNYLYPVHGFRSVGEASRDFRVLASWELSPTSPKLPAWIVFGSYKKFMDSEGKAGREDILQATNCSYYVRSYTNLGSLTFPREVFAQFFVHPVASNYFVARPAATVSATVTEIMIGNSPPQFQPILSGKTLITDVRPVDRDLPISAAMGTLTNWPDIQSAKAQYAHALKGRERSAGKVTQRVVLFRALFATACFLSPAFAIWRWGLSRNQRNQRHITSEHK